VPRVRQVVRDHPGVGARRTSEVLLPAMQLEVVAGWEADGDEAPAGVDRADAGVGSDEDRAGVARLEGRSGSWPRRWPRSTRRVGATCGSTGW
jgi:hypothetical protein